MSAYLKDYRKFFHLLCWNPEIMYHKQWFITWSGEQWTSLFNCYQTRIERCGVSWGSLALVRSPGLISQCVSVLARFCVWRRKETFSFVQSCNTVLPNVQHSYCVYSSDASRGTLINLKRVHGAFANRHILHIFIQGEK